MELFSAEVEVLKKFIKEWSEHPEHELESTFGNGDQVSTTTFLAIAQRLRGKGFTALPQEDRLTITLPDHTRFTINGSGQIQQYCRDNNIASKSFIAMIKNRTGDNSNLDLPDYETRIKVRRETPLGKDDSRIKEIIASWSQQKKAFRLIRRWTFQGNGVIFDLSIVRSTKHDIKGNYIWVRNFEDQNITLTPPIYEVEVELVRGDYTDTPEKAISAFIKGIGEVLRGFQKHTLLIRKSTKDKVLNGYKLLIEQNENIFRGVAPVTLEFKNMSDDINPSVPNIRSNYNVTDKADGLRVLTYCDSNGELFMIDMAMNVYRTGLVNDKCKDSLLDSEWVTINKHNKAIQQLLIFDIYISPDNKKVSNLPFYINSNDNDLVNTRFNALKSWITIWSSTDTKIIIKGLTAQTRLQVSLKTFYFASNDNTNTSIFKKAKQMLEKAGSSIYNTDGLIFTPNESPLPDRPAVAFFEQFKWKPSHDNTIDFLVITQKSGKSIQDEVISAIKPVTGENIRYKTLRLYVGSSADPAYDNPRDTLLFNRELPQQDRYRGKGKKGREYKPVLFNPKEFPDTQANISYREINLDPATGEEFITTERSQEPIQDKSIIEMRYDASLPPGWRWIPIRIRYDKTERLQKGILGRTLNSDTVAETVWNSIHEPITLNMICTGASQPSLDEMKAIIDSRSEGVSRKYYERKASLQDLNYVKGLRQFHNRAVKENILLASGLHGGKKSLIDVACGKAADLQKWLRENVSFVLGIDAAGDGIRDREDGAYRRYLNTIVNERRPEIIKPMLFVIGDSSRSIVDGKAGATDEESDMLKTIFGRVKPEGIVPPYVSKYNGILKGGADCIACMFALHYFFKDSNTFNGLLDNIRDTLKIGGLFIACFFDGDRTYNLLKNVGVGDSVNGIEGDSLIWKITKQYDNDEEYIENDDNGFGLPIDVEFISIGATHREYLVPFKLFQEKMRTIGCELLNDKELSTLGLKTSTALFDDTYKEVNGEKLYPMTDAVKQYSFLNRWCIFKRKSEIIQPVADNIRSTRGPNEVSLPYVGLPVADIKPETVVKSVYKTDTPFPQTQTQKQPATIAEALVEATRTIPVEKGPAAGPQTTYSSNDVLQFYPDAILSDKLKFGDKGVTRWLAPYAPFPIADPTDPTIKYPTLEHYLAAMLFKEATDKPNLAADIFSQNGTIHNKYLRTRLTETAGQTVPLSELRDQELLQEEMKDVKRATNKTNINRYHAVFDEPKWLSSKDTILEYGLKYRWDHDARLRRIVEAARDQNKYLLYYTGSSGTSDLGGVRRADGRIDGENKVGKGLMKLSGYPGFN